MLIDRLIHIEEIEALEVAYKKKFGRLPYNVSGWTTSKNFQKEILEVFEPPKMNNPIEYMYSYSLDEELLESLKCKFSTGLDDSTVIALMPNSTTAIVNISNLLRAYNYKKTCVLTPAYFSIEKAAGSYSLDCKLIPLINEERQYKIPIESVLEQNFDAVWITSPVYSTGYYYKNEEILKIRKLLDRGILVISDESFCVGNQRLIRYFENHPNFIAIYSPHKGICINSYKFSAILYNRRFNTFIDQWIDVLSGNLPASTYGSAKHFLASNFEVCQQAYESYMEAARTELAYLLKAHKHVSFNFDSEGSMYTIFVHNRPYEESESIDFMRKVIMDTGASFYPAFLNGLGYEYGFTFRINIALYDSEFALNLNKLLLYLR